jgi:DNA-directed RNA polymerase specialized sigma24 family protein
VLFVDDYAGLDEGDEVELLPSEEQRLDHLVAWVQERAQLRPDSARLVVLTRAGGFSVDELAAVESVDPQTLRQRRLRAERRVRQGLSLAV